MFDQRYFSKHPKYRKRKSDAELAEEVKTEYFLSSSNRLDKANDATFDEQNLISSDHKGDINESNEDVHVTGHVLGFYFKAGEYALMLTRGKYEHIFNAFMFTVILIAAVDEGIRTYPSFANNAIMSAIDVVVFSTFAMECLMKVVTERLQPLQYFVGKDGIWNTFDFLILIFCVPGISSFKGKSASVLRLVVKIFRLFRVAKLLRTIPALNVIIMGLVGGMESIAYIGLLMFIFIYVYAVVGVLLFAKTDPFFFRSMPIALMTLFHALTFDNWGINFYITAYGCDMFNGGIYFSESNMTFAEWESVPPIYRCDQPEPSMGLAFVYWISYVTITALIILWLFIGVITVSMQTSMAIVRIEAEEVSKHFLDFDFFESP